MLPSSIQNRIQQLIVNSSAQSSLIHACKQLTKRYRNPHALSSPQNGFSSSFEALAYVATRLPATFAAVEAVLPHIPLKDVSSVLDLGAGPGTAALAAALNWVECKTFHLVEENDWMNRISQQLLQGIPEIRNQNFLFLRENLLSFQSKNSYDVIFLSYVLTELPLEDQTPILKRVWESTKQGLVILVPGTPLGYQQLMSIRNFLMEMGAFIVAPCPHHNACPLLSGDWCHFSTRFLRPSFHREIKNVSLPYEDEKFSYLVALQQQVPKSSARIIRKPLRRSGHVILDLCTANGIERKTLSKRDKEYYKKAIKVVWGDEWN